MLRTIAAESLHRNQGGFGVAVRTPDVEVLHLGSLLAAVLAEAVPQASLRAVGRGYVGDEEDSGDLRRAVARACRHLRQRGISLYVRIRKEMNCLER